MEDLNKEYEEILEEWDKVDNTLEKLKQKATVIKYLDLLDQRNELRIKANSLYKKICFKRYETCKHVLIESYIERDDYEGRTYRYYGCIKCGLDEGIEARGYPRTEEEREALSFMKSKNAHYIGGIKTGICCDLQKARDLYSEIMEKNPDLSEEERISIFKERAKSKKLTLSR